MASVDIAYYTSVYQGQEADEYSFPALEARAEDVVCAMTRWKVTGNTIASFAEFQQTLVKKAICAQVDYFALNGLDSASGGAGVGFSVGKVHVDGKANASAAGAGSMSGCISPLVMMYLEQSGLMGPQVPVMPELLMGGWI